MRNLVMAGVSDEELTYCLLGRNCKWNKNRFPDAVPDGGKAWAEHTPWDADLIPSSLLEN